MKPLRTPRRFLPTAVLVLASLSLVAGMAAGRVPGAARAAETGDAPPLFSDLPEDHWAAVYIEQLASSGVLVGDGDGTFGPDRPVTRAEAAKMLVTANLGGTGGLQGARSFSDVPQGAWFHPYVELAHRLGVAEGLGDATFAPNRPVTREEFATMLVRALALLRTVSRMTYAETQSLLTFIDGGAITGWARKPVAMAVRLQLVRGFEDGAFRPSGETDRAQAAAMVARLQDLGGLPGQAAAVDGLEVHFQSNSVFTATAYGSFPEDNYPWFGAPSYIGLPLREGIVAVDPAVIPLGSLVYVQGYGYGIAADTGGAIKGNRIDLFLDGTRAEVAAFGIQNRTVYIVRRPYTP